MARTLLFFASLAAMFGQNAAGPFNPPPPEVDKVLRERMTAFYQYHVEGKPRLAEKYVAEDTQDLFYRANKPKYLGFEIRDIVYSDNFTRARATVFCEMYMPLLGLDKPVKIPEASLWKIENGQWFWYVDMSAGIYGTMKPGPQGSGGGAMPIPSKPPSVQQLAADVNSIFDAVKLDRQQVTLKAQGESSERVSITNTMPGTVDLSVLDTASGVKATLDRAKLNSGEKAVLTLSSNGKAKSGSVVVDVAPTNRKLHIAVEVK